MFLVQNVSNVSCAIRPFICSLNHFAFWKIFPFYKWPTFFLTIITNYFHVSKDSIKILYDCLDKKKIQTKGKMLSKLKYLFTVISFFFCLALKFFKPYWVSDVTMLSKVKKKKWVIWFSNWFWLVYLCCYGFSWPCPINANTQYLLSWDISPAATARGITTTKVLINSHMTSQDWLQAWVRSPLQHVQ